uniref:protein-serine/threonine phosphatase n=1 Tax=Kalanchoe fedtschenkoi TaxID=63787 RepID=A0A7N0U940_KALFE
MGHFTTMFHGLSKSFPGRKGRKSRGCGGGREAAEAMAKDAKKNDRLLCSTGVLKSDGSSNFASVCSRRGRKGVNQDCCTVWEGFGCQEDMMFCGVFDGHGPWGHFVAKRIRESMPSTLLCNWQESLTQTSPPEPDSDSAIDRCNFNIWKRSYVKTCAVIDRELKQQRKIDAYSSGTTAVSIVRQGEMMVIANVGDSRAVLASTGDDGSLVAVQLTVDFKPNLPQECKRIVESNGRVFCLDDEPGVHRVWLPHDESPGLAMSRAFGDHCVKEFGLISVPEVTQRRITSRDHFVVLATDGVWDVMSNQEAVEIVSSTPNRADAAKCLVKWAARGWKHKRRGIAMDDISAICLFLHPSPADK